MITQKIIICLLGTVQYLVIIFLPINFLLTPLNRYTNIFYFLIYFYQQDDLRNDLNASTSELRLKRCDQGILASC